MFEIRDEQYAALRRQVFTEKLLKIFEHSDKSAFYDPASQKVLIQDGQGHTSSLGFDKYGFFGSMTSPLGRTWQLDNDSEGKLLGLLTPAGLRLGFDYDEDGDMARITRNHQPLVYLDYETKGFPKTITYADNTKTQLSYNKLLKITAITDRQGQSETFDYDADGDLIAIRDSNGNHTRFDYSVWNRPDRVRYADGSTESYHYTQDGLLQRLVSGADSVANIVSYNEAGQPTEIRYSEENVLYFKYDQAGRIIEARNLETTVKYVYDAKGRVIQEDQGGQVVQHHYDELGLLIGLTYPSGDRVEFTYDADQRLSTVKDWQGGVHRFTYLERERGVKQFHPNGLMSQIHQSEMGVTTKIEVFERGASQPLFGFRYQYDDEDRVKVFEDSQFGRREYGYDAKGQVLAVKSKNARQTETFAYDPAGNRVRCHREEAQFNSLNQLIQQGSIRCRYDGRGNLTEMFAQGVMWRYTFNQQNQLIRAESTAGTVVTFGYDALGRRLWKRCGTKEVRYFWSGEDLLVEEVYQERQRVSTQDYLYIPHAYKLLATRINQEVYDYHTDHLGTPRRLTDKLGKVVWAADYSAFGVTSITVSKVANQIRFLGQYLDVETGWHYNRFRYYSPGLGRYVSRDPIGYLAGLNFYVYVGNNTVNFHDRLGLCINDLLLHHFCPKCILKGIRDSLGDLLKGAIIGIGIIAIGAVIGAVVGAVVGLAAGGVGAIPGAIAGAIIGAELTANALIVASVGMSLYSLFKICQEVMELNNNKELSEEEKNKIRSERLGNLIVLLPTTILLVRAAAKGLPKPQSFNELALKLSSSKVMPKVPVEKFSQYIFKPNATHGKTKIFTDLGYTFSDSELLANIYQKQGLENFLKGEYTLGKLDQYGQRIDIEIVLNGIGKQAGKTSYLKSGWMLTEDGIQLNTPFTGFTR